MADNVTRLLRVLELLAAAPPEGISAADLADRAGIASSTLYRMLGELERSSYLFRSADRLIHPNFSFEQRIATATISPSALREACAAVSQALRTASEVIVMRRQHLLWHVTDEHPMQAIRLRAHPGFLRDTYELDAPSRLALAHLPIDEIERDWDRSAFHETGVARTPVDWADARATLSAVDPGDMAFDRMGNAKGVRRYCVAIPDEHGRLVCLLTVAEAAIPLADEKAHVERIRDVLEQGRMRLLPTVLPHAAQA